MSLVIAASIAVVGLIALVSVLARRMTSKPGLPFAAASLDEFTPEPRPPNGRARRTYLRELAGDFKRTSMALEMVIVQSEHDCPELAIGLLRRQITFACRMLIVRLRLVRG
jgi:hypothetical protein